MRRFFTALASRSAYLMGHPAAFVIATLACVVWAVTGPVFAYSDTWQLVINTATTVLTFLAVFLIQNSQNRDGAAIQAKLDEILISVSSARTELVGIENLTDAEVTELKAAIEREALQPGQKVAEKGPTVAQILKSRDRELKEKELAPADRRDVVRTVKRAAETAKAQNGRNGRKAGVRKRAKKPPASKPR